LAAPSLRARAWPGRAAGALPNVQALALLAAATPSTLTVSAGATGGSGPFTAQLMVSTDAGTRWTTAATDT